MKTKSTLAMLAHCNRDLTYRVVNRMYADALGLSPEDIIGRQLADVLGNDAVSVLLPRIDEVLQGRCVEFEASVPFSRLGVRRVKATYTPTLDVEGNVDGWIASLSPIPFEVASEDQVLPSERSG